MRAQRRTSVAALLVALSLPACSFQGSVTEATSPPAAGSTGPTAAAGTTTGTGTASSSAPPGATTSSNEANTSASTTTSPSPPASATTPPGRGLQEIRFAPGGTSTSVQGVADAGMSEPYFFAARAQQTAVLTVDSPGGTVGFSLVSPDGEPLKTLASEATTGTFDLPASGNYVVGIGSPTAGVAYTLTLTIR